MHMLLPYELSKYMISHCNSEVFRITVNDLNANRVHPVGTQICSATHCNPSNISRLIQYKQIMRDVMPCSLVDK